MKILNRSSSWVAALVWLMTFASAQAQQPTTAAIEPTPPGREDAIPSTASLTNRDQKTQIASEKEAATAEKEKAWATELIPLSTNTSNDTAQAKQAVPAERGDASELAKKLSNPVSSLISFPVQTNFDFGMGTGSDGG